MSLTTKVWLIINAIAEHPAAKKIVENVVGSSVGVFQARLSAFHPQAWIEMVRTARTVESRIKRDTEPYLLEFLRDGLQQYFGVDVAVPPAHQSGVLGPPGGDAEKMGRGVLRAMFTSLEAEGDITPEAGLVNTERFISFAMHSAVEGWLLKNLEGAWLDEIFPHWGELHDVVQQSLGLGRLMRRVFAPLLNALMVEPTTRRINRAFHPAFWKESQAVHALNAGHLSEDAFFSVMEELGYSRELAGQLRHEHTKNLTEADIELGRVTRALSEEDELKGLQALGYSEDLARVRQRITNQTRIAKINEQVATVARTMFAKREMSEAEYRSALTAARVGDEEVQGLLGLGLIERARPTRLTHLEIDAAFEDGLVDLGRYRQWAEEEGFSLEDQIVLEQIALKKKLAADAKKAKPAAESAEAKDAKAFRPQAEELHRRGLLGDAELAAVYTAAGLAPERVALLMRLAGERRAAWLAAEEKRQKPPPTPLAPRASMEEAFVRGIVNEQRVVGLLLQEKVPEADVPAIIAVLRQKREEFKARQEATAQKAAAAAGKLHLPLPRASAEEAHRFGLITTARLGQLYLAEHFAPAAAAELVAIAEKRREDYVAAQLKHQAPPKVPEPPLAAHEAAFQHGIIDEAALTQHYVDQGFDPEDVQLLVEIQLQKKEHAQAAAAAAVAQAAGAKHKARAIAPGA
jgi:hypothetical protein